MQTFSISLFRLKEPSALVLFYLVSLSMTFIFVDRVGQSTIIDELVLLFILPIATVGFFRYFFFLGVSAKLIVLYFFFAAVSSAIALALRPSIPFAAPILGLVLDTKFIILFGGLLYLVNRSEKNGGGIVLDICLVIVILGLINSIFFIRDIFSGGVSISGIKLRPSAIFGYVPIGLFSHKLYTAAVSALAFSSAITLYLCIKNVKYLFFSFLFLIILILASSMKELGVLLALSVILLRAVNNKYSNISGTSKKLILVAMLLLPILAFVFGSALDKLVTSRFDVYLFEENARAALHIKSAEIASDYFPLGSGAGTFSSQPSRSLYYSPLYYEYGMNYYYGASEEFSAFLMDVGWPKFIAEAGWIGGGAYFMAYMIAMLALLNSFFISPSPMNIFGVMLGSVVFSSALGSAIFTGDLGLLICALFFLCAYLDRNEMVENKSV